MKTTNLLPEAQSSRAPSAAELGSGRPIPNRRPAWLSESAWPFQTSALDVDGCRIAVTDVGQGPVLLFVHTGFWSFVWRDLMLRLNDEFRCICFDAPGTGQSGRLPSTDITLDRASRALVAVIKVLDLKGITLVLHDLGGPSGLAGAAWVPDRIRGLCAVNTFAWRPSGVAFRGMLAMMGSTAMREFDALTGLLPRITAGPFGIGRHMDERSRRTFLAGIGPQGIRAFHSYMRDAGRSDVLYDRVQQALEGPFRELPLMTIFGESNDPLGFQARWRALFADAPRIVVGRGNHFPMCDDPNLVAVAIRTWHRNRVVPTLV
jgi:pimeloyl-ACP methyl ester carboxylesterase